MSVTQCHLANGFQSSEQTQYLHLQVSNNPSRTDVMFLCNIWHHSTQSTVSHHRRPESSSWFCLQDLVRHDSSASLSVPKQ